MLQKQYEELNRITYSFQLYCQWTNGVTFMVFFFVKNDLMKNEQHRKP